MRLRKKKTLHLYSHMQQGKGINLPIYKGKLRGRGFKSFFSRMAKKTMPLVKKVANKIPGIAKELGKEVGGKVLQGVIAKKSPKEILKSAINKDTLKKGLAISKKHMQKGKGMRRIKIKLREYKGRPNIFGD